MRQPPAGDDIPRQHHLNWVSSPEGATAITAVAPSDLGNSNIEQEEKACVR